MAAKQPSAAGGKHFPLTSQVSAPSNYQSLQVAAQPQGVAGAQGTSTMSPNKMVNAATFCKSGQEIIYELVQKASDIFGQGLGKQGTIQLPNNVSYTAQNHQERKQKLEEQLKTLSLTFKKLRAIYDKVEETCSEMEEPTYEQLVPIVGRDIESFPVNSEVYPYVADEHRELVEQVRVKNQQLKEIIDQIRSINWEINTMITMRKN
ncbi:mediator of RNA polymerase II transcription subunit 30 [Patella vulgata]|uniref:mediator of RNA polymerase II transcription subunit 30 n=1 Tax=Patella vulgata TaxID=6465 RepID=UPI0021801A8A|nr:mediator of RNA polymerase II transcription subunit 30 [Patella vulgata]XP_050393551.1 mediator of RNA polymerase II transcription subunit 30 [Patella vulgata]